MFIKWEEGSAQAEKKQNLGQLVYFTWHSPETGNPQTKIFYI